MIISFLAATIWYFNAGLWAAEHKWFAFGCAAVAAFCFTITHIAQIQERR